MGASGRAVGERGLRALVGLGEVTRRDGLQSGFLEFELGVWAQNGRVSSRNGIGARAVRRGKEGGRGVVRRWALTDSGSK